MGVPGFGLHVLRLSHRNLSGVQEPQHRGPLPEDVFSIPVTTVSTFVLLMSSMSMVLAYAALTRNSMKAFRIWLASTCLLGATFVGFQVYEFTTFANYEHKVYCADVGVKELTPVKQELAKKCGTEDEHDGT